MERSMKKNAVLLSIKPAFANLIVDGIKTVELRRKFPQDVKGKCYIYSSSPTKAIIGECNIDHVQKLTIEELWKNHSENSMIGWEEFNKYFQGQDYGYALILNSYLRYDSPVGLDSKIQSNRPPQSFCYTN